MHWDLILLHRRQVYLLRWEHLNSSHSQGLAERQEEPEKTLCATFVTCDKKERIADFTPGDWEG